METGTHDSAYMSDESTGYIFICIQSPSLVSQHVSYKCTRLVVYECKRVLAGILKTGVPGIYRETSHYLQLHIFLYGHVEPNILQRLALGAYYPWLYLQCHPPLLLPILAYGHTTKQTYPRFRRRDVSVVSKPSIYRHVSGSWSICWASTHVAVRIQYELR